MGYRILLIDDEDDILEFVKYNLERDGYEVFTASNGAEGIQQACGYRYAYAVIGKRPKQIFLNGEHCAL